MSHLTRSRIIENNWVVNTCCFFSPPKYTKIFYDKMAFKSTFLHTSQSALWNYFFKDRLQGLLLTVLDTSGVAVGPRPVPVLWNSPSPRGLNCRQTHVSVLWAALTGLELNPQLRGEIRFSLTGRGNWKWWFKHLFPKCLLSNFRGTHLRHGGALWWVYYCSRIAVKKIGSTRHQISHTDQLYGLTQTPMLPWTFICVFLN